MWKTWKESFCRFCHFYHDTFLLCHLFYLLSPPVICCVSVLLIIAHRHSLRLFLCQGEMFFLVALFATVYFILGKGHSITSDILRLTCKCWNIQLLSKQSVGRGWSIGCFISTNVINLNLNNFFFTLLTFTNTNYIWKIFISIAV